MFTLKFITFLALENFLFEAIRAKMKKTIGGDEHLDNNH